MQKVNDIVENGVLLFEVLKVRDLLHRLFDEVEHFVIVLVNAGLDLIQDGRLHCDDLLEASLGQLAQVAVLFGDYFGRCEAVVDDRNFTKEVAGAQDFLFLVLYTVVLWMLDVSDGALNVRVLRDLNAALTLRYKVDGLTFIVLVDDLCVRFAELGFHPLHNRPDQLFFFVGKLFLGNDGGGALQIR